MFTRKKRRYRSYIFAAAALTLCLLVIAIAWPQPQAEVVSGSDKAKNSQQQETTQKSLPGLSPGEDDETDEADSNTAEENDADMNPDEQSYYLVKRAGQQIVVYFCNASGEQVQLEETQILYEMLGPEDQKLFDEGIRLDSQEELGMLLQDFES